MNNSFEDSIRKEIMALVDEVKMICNKNLPNDHIEYHINKSSNYQFVRIMNSVKAVCGENYSMGARGVLEKAKNNELFKSLLAKRISSMLLNFEIERPVSLDGCNKFIDKWVDTLANDLMQIEPIGEYGNES